MAAIFELDQFDKLPLWGQVLIATRMVRRAMLATSTGSPTSAANDAWPETANAACDAIDECAAAGDGVHHHKDLLDRATVLRGGGSADTRAVREALWFAIDAARAAQAAYDFPIDATVTRSAQTAIASLAADARFSQMQIAVLMASDLDLVRVATGEARIGKYDGLTKHVFLRLTPVHPLTLDDRPKRSAEDEAR